MDPLDWRKGFLGHQNLTKTSDNCFIEEFGVLFPPKNIFFPNFKICQILKRQSQNFPYYLKIFKSIRYQLSYSSKCTWNLGEKKEISRFSASGKFEIREKYVYSGKKCCIRNLHPVFSVFPISYTKILVDLSI